MNGKTLGIIAFLCLPIGMLISVSLLRDSLLKGKSADVWFHEMKVGGRSPGLDALRKMGKTSLPILRKALKSPERYQRFRAAWALGQLGPAANEAVPDLIRALDDNDVSVQIYSMQSLTTIGTAREDIIPKLIAKLDNRMVRNYAADLLNEIERRRRAQNLRLVPGSEFDYAMAFVRSPVPNIRLMGAQKLVNIEPRDQRVVKAIDLLLSDPNEWVRRRTAGILANQRAKGTNQVNLVVNFNLATRNQTSCREIF